jgi:hypothetical protein
MKCIQSVKATKNVEVGTIIRVDDKEADLKVKDGYWKYVPKSEWKLKNRKQKNVVEEVRQTYPANVEGSKEFNKVNKKSNK